MAGTDRQAKELIDIGDREFELKHPWDALAQEIALNVYPEKADFIRPLILGQETAAHLADSFPWLIRRDLGNALSAMLRPRDRAWFRYTTQDEDLDDDPEVKKFLEYMQKATRNAIYDPRAQFIRSTKEADHDFVTFGMAAISVEESPLRDHILFRCHHLKNICFLENDVGVIDHLHRKDRMSARALVKKFKPTELHESIIRASEKEPGKEFDLRVVTLPRDEYDAISPGARTKKKMPYITVYVDMANNKIIRECPVPIFQYVIPRWHRVSNTQYAFSQSTMTSLPDARMAQALSSIVLEAGEKQVSPPILARDEFVRDVNLQAGAITWADTEYDGKISDHFLPLHMAADMKSAFAMQQSLREMLSRSYFIDKLALPEAGKEMTAYEVAQRLEEHVRNLLPLFEPMEVEYNTQLLDKSFAVLNNLRTFNFQAMPNQLRKLKQPPTWKFVNPMQEVSERILVQQFQEVTQVEQGAQQVGVSVPRVDFAAARDGAIKGIGGPAKWLRTDAQMQAAAEEAAQQAQQAQQDQQLSQGAAQVSQIADAGQRVSNLIAPPVDQKTPKQQQLPLSESLKHGPPMRLLAQPGQAGQKQLAAPRTPAAGPMGNA